MVWIFARRPLYASYDHHEAVLGMSSVLDQQLAGFLAKLCTIAVLWTVAFSLMMRSNTAAGAGEDPEPLLWSDVEREIQRADRRALRTRSAWLPKPHCPKAPRRPRITHHPRAGRVALTGAVHLARWDSGTPCRERSGQRSSPELVERQLGRLIATALRALLDVTPRAE